MGTSAERSSPRRLPNRPRLAGPTVAAVVFVVALVCPGLASARDQTPEQVQATVSFDQRLGAQVPLDLVFRDESGQPALLRSYFGGKPVVLLFDYYSCPNLCPEVLDSLSGTLKGFPLALGGDFNVVTVSIDPRDGPSIAAKMRAEFGPLVGTPSAGQGWHFLTGDEKSIEKLTQTVGFHYAYDAEQNEYAHPAGVIVLTPGGTVSRYLYGLDYPQRDLRLALVEASGDRIGSPVDQLLLTCYHYNPSIGRYTGIAFGAVQVGAGLTALSLGALVLCLWWRDRFGRRATGTRAADTGKE